MINRIRLLVILITVPLLLVSCKGKEPQSTAPVKKPQAAKPVEAAKATEALEAAAKIEPTEGASLRNPFLNYILITRGTEKPKKIKGPLECCELSSFKLIAVVSSADNAFALIQSPENKRYVVRRGDVMGVRDGRVVKIEARSITVRELTKDERGRTLSSNDVELRLASEKEGEFSR